MRISKRQLKRIIKEEHSRLHEQSRAETGSSLIEFARAYAGLGSAVQEQVDEVVATYINRGGPGSVEWEESVFKQNPAALDMALQRLGSSLRSISGGGADEEAETLIEVLEEASTWHKAD
jgi:hypothetical protein